MTRDPLRTCVVAVVKHCGQFRYRVELADGFDDAQRTLITRRALLETTETFLACTRDFQSIAWIGTANLAFAHFRYSPQDCKSNFLHGYVCLKMLELSFTQQKEKSAKLAIRVEVTLPESFRKDLKWLCKKYGVEMQISPEPSAKTSGESDPRGAQADHGAFIPELLRKVETIRTSIFRKSKGRSPYKRLVRAGMDGLVRCAWLYHICLRVAFHCYYRAALKRAVRRMGTTDKVFLYFEIRSGRNREVGSYLEWKYSAEFLARLRNSSPIPFAHLSNKAAPYSREAMSWARRSLRQLETDPSHGCVVANFLMSPRKLLKSHLSKPPERKGMRKRLKEMAAANDDFLATLFYEEFRSSISVTQTHVVELAECYRELFGAMEPGVVIQADAIARGARQFTACARRRGGQVIYVADRICTRLRTSNQLIADEGDNPHLPNRCVVFEEISNQELIRQGFAADHIYHYHRNSGALEDAPTRLDAPPRRDILVLLQAYTDNMGVMISAGVEILRNHPDLRVILQEHPHFPVSGDTKSRLLQEMPGRLRFLARGEKVDYAGILAMITGYSTAAIPGVLLGTPLIWLRREIDNSVYGEAYLGPIGFAADSTGEVLEIVARLRERDPQTVAECAAAVVAVREIFSSSSGHLYQSLAGALDQALSDSFSAMAARSGGAVAREAPILSNP